MRVRFDTRPPEEFVLPSPRMAYQQAVPDWSEQRLWSPSSFVPYPDFSIGYADTADVDEIDVPFPDQTDPVPIGPSAEALLVARPVKEDRGFRLTIPTVVTFCGYAAGLAWLAGGPGWLCLASILADEIDGALARKIGQTSRYGKELDYSVDLSLTSLSALRLFGMPGLAILPIVTALQAEKRSRDATTAFGSTRAAFMLGALLTGR